MLTSEKLFSILNNKTTICHLYDKEMDRRASLNMGKYELDENTQREVANKAFNSVLKENTINVSWAECVAIFDIIDRGV